jgi:amidohydrolase family protein
MIIDAHIHVGAWSHVDFLGRGCDLPETLAMLRATGVDGGVLMPSDTCDNRSLREQMKRALEDGAGDRAGALSPRPSPRLSLGLCPCLWMCAWIQPHARDELAWVRAHRVDLAGLKIHPSLSRHRVNDEGFRAALEMAEEEGLVVLVHCGRWTETAGWAHALDAAARHPGARFLLAHAGGDTPPNATNAARAVAERGLTNVWFEISGLREYWVVERNVALLGADRYLLGSDYPLAHPRMYLGAIAAMDLPEAAREKIRGENARALFGPPMG